MLNSYAYGIEQPTDLHVNLGAGAYLNTAIFLLT